MLIKIPPNLVKKLSQHLVSPNLVKVNHLIFHQIWWFPKIFTKFGDNFATFSLTFDPRAPTSIISILILTFALIFISPSTLFAGEQRVPRDLVVAVEPPLLILPLQQQLPRPLLLLLQLSGQHQTFKHVSWWSLRLSSWCPSSGHIFYTGGLSFPPSNGAIRFFPL